MSKDAELVNAALNGDVHAFTDLVGRYSNAICAVAYGVLGDFHVAQDVAQEAFVKGYFKLQTLKNPETFGSWLYAIAYRLSLDWLRKLQKEQRAIAGAGEEATLHRDSFEETIEKREIQVEVWKALAKLDERNRIIVTMFHLNEFTMESIGTFLNMTVAAVDSRLRRARKVIKEELLVAHFAEMFKLNTNQSMVTQVTQRIVKQMGHFYISVAHKASSTAWFVEHFGLSEDGSGDLLLPSGQTLYLIQTNSAGLKLITDKSYPVLSFAVDNSQYVYDFLRIQGIRLEVHAEEFLNSMHFFFYDLDNNKFGIHQAN
ncbi:RNA polymerase sigma factor [Paenibacillus psychroresistens]|uniref:RNA polymerase sigma factor n=1 Tax=Paenibacillus psychroresistens TaxID=1778678 RepID=UPI0013908C99|nr:RNA polymerase sigma factor [Paenibacillus psychroresistens]